MGHGVIKNLKATLQLKPNSKPRFHKARQVPFDLKQAIELELDRLEREGIVRKVNHR